MVESYEGSEDVAEFLLRIRELEQKRQREDEEQTRKLEQDIIESRRQREERRAGGLSLLLCGVHIWSTG